MTTVSERLTALERLAREPYTEAEKLPNVLVRGCDARLSLAARDDLPALIRVARAAEVRIEWGHDNGCNVMRQQPCNCGQDELCAALDALAEGPG